MVAWGVGAMSTDVGTLVFDYGRAARVLDRNEAREAVRVAEVVKQCLWDKASAFIAKHSHAPLLFSYASDGTPMTTVSRHVVQAHAKRRVAREGGRLREFLVQRGFVKAMGVDGGGEVCVLLSDPLPMDEGKSAWHCFSAAVQFYPMLREKGHVGIAISHYGFDRALYEALQNKLRMRHAKYYEDLAESGKGQSQLLALTDWVVSTGCGNHDCQNALKWGLREMMGEDPEALLKDMYIAMEACRHGYSALHDNLRWWLLRVVRFKSTGFRHEHALEFWGALGVDEDMVHIAAQLNLVWVGGELCVNPAAEGSADLMDKLSGLVLYLFRFRKFTQSRWTTLGECSRVLVCAMSVGLIGFVESLRVTPGVSDWHLRGFGRLGDEGKRFVSLCALAASVPDAVLVALLEDDRVAGRVAHFEGLLKHEFGCLANLSTTFWTRVASLSTATASELRSDALRVATIAAGYIDHKLLRVARAWPWRIADGDIDANLTELSNQGEVMEPTTVKIQQLVGMGFNRAALTSAIELMRQVHWTTTGVEQGHGSAAVLHRQHARLGAEQLCGRALLHMARPLFANDEEIERRRRAEDTVAKLKRKVPGRCSGQNMFLKDLFVEAKALLPDGEKLAHSTTLKIFSQHGEMYRRLTPAAQAVYDTAASRHADASTSGIADDIKAMQSDELERRRKVSDERFQQGVMMRLSHCRLGAEDRRVMNDLFVSSAMKGNALDALRVEALRPPRPPTSASSVAWRTLALLASTRRRSHAPTSGPGWCATAGKSSPTPPWSSRPAAVRSTSSSCTPPSSPSWSSWRLWSKCAPPCRAWQTGRWRTCGSRRNCMCDRGFTSTSASSSRTTRCP